MPTTLYALTGHLTETTARLPFALANLTALFAVFLLGWRLLGPIAGWSAALLLALDGYFIGFSRIVQYQSIIFLTSALVVLILYRLYRQPRGLMPYLTLASIFLATGLLSHYEAAQVVVPPSFWPQPSAGSAR
ncbi:MAG: glycosyltransferase family 39 protein [Caldilineaceae bacterium]|nr:glycosyltransferase family 39 protein [Caldilineaceae bacterium]